MGFWFGRKSVPEGRRPWLPVWLAGSNEAGFARHYSARVEEVFASNPVGQRAVRLVASAVGGLKLFGEGERGGEAIGLVQADALMERVAAAVLLHGNGYVQLMTDSRDEPAELVALRPERVSVELNKQGWPVGYTYAAGGRETVLSAEDALGRRQVAHVRALSVGSDHYGEGCLGAAIAAATIHNRASQWNRALLDNAARPSGALTYDPGDGTNLSGEQYDRLKAELADQYQGAANAGRPMLLDGGMRWQAMSLTPAEMDFVALKEGAARDIALAFGVPPVLVGLPGDATYANAREAGRALMRQTVLPLARSILAPLSRMLGDWLGPVAIRVDEDAIHELAEDRGRLFESLSAADFLTRSEKRRQLGFEPDEEATP